jgi:hypothetical protein
VSRTQSFPPPILAPSLQEDRLLEVVSQYLGPPYFVQHTPTLFKQLEIPAMFATLRKQRARLLPVVEGHPVSERELGNENEGAAGDNGSGAVDGGLPLDVEAGGGARSRGESAAVCIECTSVPASAAPPACVVAEVACSQAGSTRPLTTSRGSSA